jgi:hypothetical protein
VQPGPPDEVDEREDATGGGDESPGRPDADALRGDVLDVNLDGQSVGRGDVELAVEGSGGARQLVARTCPYCLTGFTTDAKIAICSACGSPHHADCWRENGGCTAYGCSQGPDGVRAASAVPSRRRRAETDPVVVLVPGPAGRIRATWARAWQPADLERQIELATVCSIVGLAAGLHPVFCPLMILSGLGVARAVATAAAVRKSGERLGDLAAGVRLAVVLGVLGLVVAVVRYCELI